MFWLGYRAPAWVCFIFVSVFLFLCVFRVCLEVRWAPVGRSYIALILRSVWTSALLRPLRTLYLFSPFSSSCPSAFSCPNWLLVFPGIVWLLTPTSDLFARYLKPTSPTALHPDTSTHLMLFNPHYPTHAQTQTSTHRLTQTGYTIGQPPSFILPSFKTIAEATVSSLPSFLPSCFSTPTLYPPLCLHFLLLQQHLKKHTHKWKFSQLHKGFFTKMVTSWIKRFHTSWTKGVKTNSRTFMLRSLHFEIIIAGSWSSADALMVRCVGFFFVFLCLQRLINIQKGCFLVPKQS